MAIRTAKAVWEGTLTEGTGTLSSESGAIREAAYSFPSRFQEGTGTNPEELIAAAHAGCFSMALSHGLAQAGHPPTRIQTEARVHLEKGDEGFSITRIELVTDAEVPGVDEASFQEHAQGAKKGCPVSRALGAVPIELKATLAP
jgi:lipoyl-dependent peroxiredoxin